ncbi:unnamed protein product [Effrenium voratum]|nr:unnamed protein product [Effrenium voratum]
MCFPGDAMCCFQEDELRPDSEIMHGAGLVSTGEDVAQDSQEGDVFHEEVKQIKGDDHGFANKASGEDFRLKEHLSPALRQEVQQIKADLAAREGAGPGEVDGHCEARVPPRTSADRGKGASGLLPEVPPERPLAFEVGHGSFAFAPPPEDRFQGFQEVGTLREALSI